MLREAAGSDSLELELPDGATVGEALAALRARADVGDQAGRLPLVLAVNREYAPEGRRLDAGDELALIPPVSGGATTTGPALHARVTAERLSIDALWERVRTPAAGAIVTFSGTTRERSANPEGREVEIERLRYEAYEEMAVERIRSILAEAAEQHGLTAAAAEHRTGEVPLGEPSVVVAVSAPHRGGAFAGAREVIDRIKSEAPIWKQEVSVAGQEWVDGVSP